MTVSSGRARYGHHWPIISTHTLERHITHVYQKIGARGRAEATAFALTHGLT